MQVTVIAERITHGKYYTDTAWGLTKTQRGCKLEQVQRLQYTKQCYRWVRDRGELVQEGYTEEVDMLVLYTVFWSQNENGYPSRPEYCPTWGSSQSPLKELPEWAKETA